MHEKSKQVIKEKFTLYTDGGATVPDILYGTTIVHVYPAEDTITEDGELNGYYQNLFFKMVVFNITKTKNIMYKPNRNYDAIFTTGCDIENITVFKDGAFCVKIQGKTKFLDGQACTFYKE